MGHSKTNISRRIYCHTTAEKQIQSNKNTVVEEHQGGAQQDAHPSHIVLHLRVLSTCKEISLNHLLHLLDEGVLDTVSIDDVDNKDEALHVLIVGTPEQP